MEDYKITISEKAAEQIKMQLQKNANALYLRIGVNGGGCQGYSYVLRFDQSISEKDITIQQHDITLVIDKKSVLYLKGMTLDWEQSLTKRGYKIINPNEVKRCGCGSSFAI